MEHRSVAVALLTEGSIWDPLGRGSHRNLAASDSYQQGDRAIDPLRIGRCEYHRTELQDDELPCHGFGKGESLGIQCPKATVVAPRSSIGPAYARRPSSCVFGRLAPCYLRDLGGYSVIYRVAQHKQGLVIICTYRVTNSSNSNHSQVYEGVNSGPVPICLSRKAT